MSLFGVGWGGLPLNYEKIKVAEKQLEYLNSVQESIMNNCKTKCFVKNYAEAEISKAEMCCIDRCVSKFIRSTKIINDVLEQSGMTPETLTEPIRNPCGETE